MLWLWDLQLMGCTWSSHASNLSSLPPLWALLCTASSLLQPYYWNYVPTTPFYSSHWSFIMYHPLLIFAIKRHVPSFSLVVSCVLRDFHLFPEHQRHIFTVTISTPSLERHATWFRIFMFSHHSCLRTFERHSIWLQSCIFIIIYVTYIERLMLFCSNIELII